MFEEKMRSKLKYVLLIVVACSFIMLSQGFIFGATSSQNMSAVKSQASLCLNDSREIMNSMVQEGFNVTRVNDSLKDAKSLYDSQLILESRQRPYDYSGVVSICNDISEIRDSAINARDELSTLLKFYNESLTSSMNTSSVDIIIEEIRGEIRDERYENVPELVQSAYSEITAVQSSNTAINIFYSATSRGFKAVFLKNWKIIVGVIIVLIVLFLIYRVKISLMILNRKIENLKNRKNTIKELIMQIQKDYFQFGKIPESEYNVKTKKYAELIRDIDRQIPLLQEELAKFRYKH